MPGLARLNALGLLHHVIIRRIERKKIFREKTDQGNFIGRLARLVPETRTSCYAWGLTLLRGSFAGLFKTFSRSISFITSFLSVEELPPPNNRDLCKTPPFAQSQRQAQILILEIFNIFLRLKLSPSLTLTKIGHFSKVSLSSPYALLFVLLKR